MIKSLKGKVAIVTGGNTGIGHSITLDFARAGANVVIASISITGLDKTAEEIRSLGRHVLTLKTDVTKKTEVDYMVNKTVSKFGRIDILVNNAARHGYGTFLLESDENVWDDVIDTNLKSVYLCCRAVAKVMIEQKKGNIINMSSILGVQAGISCRIYGIAKAGVAFLTKGLAGDLASYNIRVNAIAPGYVKTAMISPTLEDPVAMKNLNNKILMGRIGKPEEIAKVALFLASEDSSYITGQTIIADGGFFA